MTEQEKTEFKNQIVTEIDVKVESRLADTTKEILEAVTNIMDKKMQEFGVRQDEFEGRVVGLLQDLNVGHAQTNELKDKVEVHENVIKTNILPRLDLLEKTKI
jgi:hypothetical protein